MGINRGGRVRKKSGQSFGNLISAGTTNDELGPNHKFFFFTPEHLLILEYLIGWGAKLGNSKLLLEERSLL